MIMNMIITVPSHSLKTDTSHIKDFISPMDSNNSLSLYLMDFALSSDQKGFNASFEGVSGTDELEDHFTLFIGNQGK